MKRHEKLLREAEQLERDAIEAEARSEGMKEELAKIRMRLHESEKRACEGAELRHQANRLREEAERLRQKANEEPLAWTAWLEGGAYDGAVIELPALVEKIAFFRHGKVQEYAHAGPADEPDCDAPHGGIWFYHQPPRNPQ